MPRVDTSPDAARVEKRREERARRLHLSTRNWGEMVADETSSLRQVAAVLPSRATAQQ